MLNVKFPPKIVTIYSREEKGFNYQNNHRDSKSNNFQLDIIGKTKCKMRIVISYNSFGLRSKKVQPVQQKFT